MAIKNSWASGEVLTAADLTDTMKGVYINAQTGTTYTFATADSFVSLSNASGGTATIPANATAAFNTGAVIGVMNAGTAGSFTIGTAAGVTLNAVSGTTTLAPLESASLVKLGTNTWQLRPAAQPAGLMLITTQTFSAASSVSVNNCFSATYQNYLAMAIHVGSADQDCSVRLRASGSDATGANYQRQNFEAYGTSLGYSRNTGETSWLNTFRSAASPGAVQFLDFARPFEANPTLVITRDTHVLSTGIRWMSNAMSHSLSTSYDGFTLIAESGKTITGTLRVYGYRN